MKVLTLTRWGVNALILFILSVFSFSPALAQDGWGSDDGWGDSGSDTWGQEDTMDSTATDTAALDWGGTDDFWGGTHEEEEEEPKVVYQPYERFVPPYDSVHELVTYEGVVHVYEEFDGKQYELEIDTIMYRATQWLEEEFGKKKLKEFLTSNDVNPNASELEYKIILDGTFPLIVKPNEFTQYQNGMIEFRMEIRIREGRYRYRINNLVHIAPVRTNEKEGIATYFEYLMKTQNDVRGGDVILMSADRKINEMLAALEKKCNTGPIDEVDDW